MSYYDKYLKYKFKYLQLKDLSQNKSFNLSGGGSCGGDDDEKPSDDFKSTFINTNCGGEHDELVGGGTEMSSEYSVSETETQYGGKTESKEEAGEEAGEETEEAGEAGEAGEAEEAEEAEEEVKETESKPTPEVKETESEPTPEVEETESEPEDGQNGGGFLNNIIDQLSDSAESFDLSKGEFDSELSTLSEF